MLCGALVFFFIRHTSWNEDLIVGIIKKHFSLFVVCTSSRCLLGSVQSSLLSTVVVH